MFSKSKATTIGQHTPVFLLENPMDREAWQATVHRVTKLETTKATLHAQMQDFFFARGSAAPVRVEQEGGAAGWFAGPQRCPL